MSTISLIPQSIPMHQTGMKMILQIGTSEYENPGGPLTTANTPGEVSKCGNMVVFFF